LPDLADDLVGSEPLTGEAARMEAGFFMACLHRARVTSDSARATDELTGYSDVTRQQHRNFRLAKASTA
jgi:hypothetical protein